MVVIVAQGREELAIRIPEASESPSQAPARGRKALASLAGTIGRATAPVRAAIATPVGIAWLTASAFTVLLIAAVWPTSPDHRSDSLNAVATTQSSSAEEREEQAADLEQGSKDASRDQSDPVRKRLEDLHQRVRGRHEENGTFPAATVAAEGVPAPDRFSWLARLVAAGEMNGTPPQWDRSWRDPLNDRFVRRKIPGFLNPHVEQLTGADRYPTTHFVGVAGVGADAAELPAGHPRVGIFGHDREVRLDDIQDGASNTMLAAGVDGRLGAWAAGGSATVRSFTREPYINGPDGFGGGSAEGVPVLMADGSVRTLSPQTDPRLIRRMAAMADGLPLDSNVPGEPGDQLADAMPPHEARDAVPGGSAKPNDPAAPENESVPDEAGAGEQDPEPPPEPPNDAVADVPVPQDPPVVNVEQALSVEIARFSQSQAVPLGRLLNMIEEMAGVPFQWRQEQPADQRESILQRPMTLELRNTTVGTLLETLLGEVGLTYSVGDRQVWLHSDDDGESPQKSLPPQASEESDSDH